MAYDEGLVQRIRELLEEQPGVTEKAMFGGICFLLRGSMFAGIANENLMVRVGPEHYTAALAKPHARTMDFTGRPLKGYVYVAPEGLTVDAVLAGWLKLAIDFVTTLPPKGAKPAGGTKRAASAKAKKIPAPKAARAGRKRG